MAEGNEPNPNVNFFTATEVVNYDTENRFVVYTNGSSSTGTKPVTNNGFLITFVRELDKTKIQFFYYMSSDKIYFRGMYSGNWSDWRYLSSNLVS